MPGEGWPGSWAVSPRVGDPTGACVMNERFDHLTPALSGFKHEDLSTCYSSRTGQVLSIFELQYISLLHQKRKEWSQVTMVQREEAVLVYCVASTHEGGQTRSQAWDREQCPFHSLMTCCVRESHSVLSLWAYASDSGPRKEGTDNWTGAAWEAGLPGSLDKQPRWIPVLKNGLIWDPDNPTARNETEFR